MPGPGEDLLTLVIGPEHPGRTRAVGHDVGLRKGMPGVGQKKRKTHENDTVSKLQATLAIAMAEIAEIKARDVMRDSRNHVLNDVSLGVPNTSCGPTTTVDAFDAIKVL